MTVIDRRRFLSSAGDLYVAEDGGNMEINIITPDRVVAPIVRYPDNDESELTGPVFDPSGTRLYFSSQRGPAPGGPGITFEVTGPFRVAAAATAAPPSSAPVTTPATAALGSNAPSPANGAGALPATGGPPTTRGVGALLAALGAAGWAIGRRTRPGFAPSPTSDDPCAEVS